MILGIALPLPKKTYGDDTAKHGKIWQNMGQVHGIPIQQGQGSYGKGLIHIIPIPDTNKKSL